MNRPRMTLTLAVLFSVGVFLIAFGDFLNLQTRNNWWWGTSFKLYGALAFVLVGCGVFVLAGAIGLFVDWHRVLLKRPHTVRRGEVVATTVGIAFIIMITLTAYFAVNYTNFANVNNIANLSVSTVWTNNQTTSARAGTYSYYFGSVRYAGYVSVLVQNPSLPITNIRVIYSAYGVNFNQETVINGSGSAVFPVLPSDIEIEVGNGNALSQTETITITYYY